MCRKFPGECPWANMWREGKEAGWGRGSNWGPSVSFTGSSMDGLSELYRLERRGPALCASLTILDEPGSEHGLPLGTGCDLG